MFKCVTRTGGPLTGGHVETEWIQTDPIPRPQPQTPAPSVEIDIDDVPAEMDRWVGFSGGRDSYVVAREAMAEGLAHGVVYCDTGSGTVENLEYVRETCERHGWPLVVVPPRHVYEVPLLRYEAPGPDLHSMWFNLAKGAGWNRLWHQIDGDLKIITGVYRAESEQRMKAITSEVQHEDGNFRGWFISPHLDSDDETLTELFEAAGVDENPSYRKLQRSGDCQCFAYAARDEITANFPTHYPEHYHWLMNRERRMQEYRGRIRLLEDQFPNVVQYARDELRTRDGAPYPMMHTVFRRHLPAFWAWARDQPRRKAVLRAMQEPTCWLGHGDTSSKMLQEAAAQADSEQASICDASCNSRSVMGVSPQVERMTTEARTMQTTQTVLTDGGAEKNQKKEGE